MKKTLKTIALVTIGIAAGRMSKKDDQIQSYSIPLEEGKPSRIGYSNIMINGKTGTGMIATASSIQSFVLVRS